MGKATVTCGTAMMRRRGMERSNGVKREIVDETLFAHAGSDSREAMGWKHN